MQYQIAKPLNNIISLGNFLPKSIKSKRSIYTNFFKFIQNYFSFNQNPFISFQVIRLSVANSPSPYSKPFSESTFNFVLVINNTTITHQLNLPLQGKKNQTPLFLNPVIKHHPSHLRYLCSNQHIHHPIFT